MGCLGLSLSDFSALTPAEFRAAADSWARQREADAEDAWERMRLLATVTIQPHIKKRLTPQQLLPLPWDKPRDNRPHPPSTSERVAEIMGRKGRG